jgi:hypothetical protein
MGRHPGDVAGTPLDDLVKLEPMLSCIAAGFTLCNYGGRRHAFGALLTRCMPPTLIFFFVTATHRWLPPCTPAPCHPCPPFSL